MDAASGKSDLLVPGPGLPTVSPPFLTLPVSAPGCPCPTGHPLAAPPARLLPTWWRWEPGRAPIVPPSVWLPPASDLPSLPLRFWPAHVTSLPTWAIAPGDVTVWEKALPIAQCALGVPCPHCRGCVPSTCPKGGCREVRSDIAPGRAPRPVAPEALRAFSPPSPEPPSVGTALGSHSRSCPFCWGGQRVVTGQQ